ncbi:MAG: ribosomal RNA small subunit methyltransferase A [Endomicrobiales bacterium]|nr:ribosomal RNA small subunit methyltransferase A [Endomicrobiales bacterium]
MRQKLGQNFLTDINVAQRIADCVNASLSDTVVEIGPGRGILTQRLLEKAGSVIAVEIDKKLSERLKTLPARSKILELVNKDFLDLDLKTFGNVIYASNLPYCAATPIIEKILPTRNWDRAVFMLQKEVAQRICASPDSKEYGYFTIYCGYFASAETLFDVGPSAFRPAPKVSSSVVRFANKKVPGPDPAFFPFIKACFSQRRKNMLNAVSRASLLSKPDIANVLKSIGIDTDLRPENISFEQYRDIFDKIYGHLHAK